VIRGDIQVDGSGAGGALREMRDAKQEAMQAVANQLQAGHRRRRAGSPHSHIHLLILLLHILLCIFSTSYHVSSPHPTM
jgi:hypothetical protein